MEGLLTVAYAKGAEEHSVLCGDNIQYPAYADPD